MTDTNFDINWLETRYPFDCEARNQEVENACRNHVRDFTPLHIVDIGSGTGASCLYFLERFEADQHWTLVELNPVLIKAAMHRIAGQAKKWSYQVEEQSGMLLLRSEQKKVTVNFRQTSFLEPQNIPELQEAHLATAGAVFDLLTPEMFHDFAGYLLAHQTALLATLNYMGMAFQPEHPADEEMIARYEAHMQRPQPFGTSMGPACTGVMETFYRERGIPCTLGESGWRIGPGDREMHRFLLGFMEKSIPEMIADAIQRQRFHEWLADRRLDLTNGRLFTAVRHYDLFAVFQV